MFYTVESFYKFSSKGRNYTGLACLFVWRHALILWEIFTWKQWLERSYRQISSWQHNRFHFFKVIIAYLSQIYLCGPLSPIKKVRRPTSNISEPNYIRVRIGEEMHGVCFLPFFLWKNPSNVWKRTQYFFKFGIQEKTTEWKKSLLWMRYRMINYSHAFILKVFLNISTFFSKSLSKLFPWYYLMRSQAFFFVNVVGYFNVSRCNVYFSFICTFES